jgi:hypothetical protein
MLFLFFPFAVSEILYTIDVLYYTYNLPFQWKILSRRVSAFGKAKTR